MITFTALTEIALVAVAVIVSLFAREMYYAWKVKRAQKILLTYVPRERKVGCRCH